MPKLDQQLEQLQQRTGSNTGRLRSDAERSAFSANVRTDIASIMNQINTVYKPLVEVLSSEDALNALDFGISGNVIFTHINANLASALAFYDATQARPRTIKETVDVLITEIARLETEIVRGVDIEPFDDSKLEDGINKNTLNLQQLTSDTMGDTYSLDNDGLSDLTFSLSQHIDAIGAFFSGFPGVGNTYTPSYPSLALNVLLSQVGIDTTLDQSVVTDLPAHLGYLRTFVGMGTVGPETPTYSSHGPVTFVADGQSLEQGIQVLDAALLASPGAFTTTSNITSNSPGSYVSDDFVFGSPSLLDTGIPSHDNKFLFDKSFGAFRAGSATGTEWDTLGGNSFGWGLNTRATGPYSYSGGRENIVASEGSIIVGGGGSGIGSSIDTTSTHSFVGGGNDHTVVSSLFAVIAGGETCSITNSDHVSIGGGENHSVTESDNATIGGGGGVTAQNGATITNANLSTIGGGISNDITGVSSVISTGNTIAGGNGHSIGEGVNDVAWNTIGGGASNEIFNSTGAAIGGGASGSITEADYGSIFGGQNNTISSGANYGAILGGSDNEVIAPSSIAVSRNAKARWEGAMVHGSGLDDNGFVRVIWRGTTGGNTPTEIFLHGNGGQFVLQDNMGVSFIIRINAFQTSGGANTGHFEIRGTVTRGLGVATVAVVHNAVSVIDNPGAVVVAVGADVTTGALTLTVTGLVASPHSWTAVGEMVTSL